MESVRSRLERVLNEIEHAAVAAGRSPQDVTLVAISKQMTPAAVIEAAQAGQMDFGENRAQEAVAKYKEVDRRVRWHFVGRLQRNKVKLLVDFVHMIHSVDRLEVAQEIDRRAEREVQVLLEVNTSGEPAKGGIAPDRLEGLLEGVGSLENVQVAGLMTMAPIVADPEQARGYFRQLARLRNQVQAKYPKMSIRHLSMGMSQDYGVAIQEGSTIVRVGQAIFGPRRVGGA